ncbi:MAG: hypothetical protein ACF8QF_03500 [Phycisphaerales bacterium]
MRILQAFLAAAIVSPALGAEVYVDFHAPEGGDGTASMPFNSMHDFVPAPGDTVYLTGTVRERGVEYTGLTDVTFTGWPGRDRPVFRADIALTDGWSADSTPGVYTILPPPGWAGSVIVACEITEDWETRIDADGRHFGHFEYRGLISEVRNEPGTWTFHTQTGRFVVHPADGMSPAVSGRQYAVEFQELQFALRDCERIAISGVDFIRTGAAVSVGAGADVLIEDVNAIATDLVYAARWPTTSSPGPSGLIVQNALVHQGEIRVVGGDARFENVTIHDYPPLGLTGDVNDPEDHLGLIVRNGEDVSFSNCSFIGYPGTAGTIRIDDILPIPASPLVASTYAVRFVDCEFDSMLRFAAIDPSPSADFDNVSVAFERCRLTFDRPADQSLKTRIEPPIDIDGVDARLLFSACILDIDARGLGGFSPIQIEEGAVLFNNSTIVARLDPTQRIVRTLTTAGTVEAVQSIIVRDAPGPFILGSNTEPLADLQDSLRFDGNWFFNITNGDYHSNPAIDEAFEWSFYIDNSPNLSLGVDPVFSDLAAGDLSLALSSPIRNVAPDANLLAPERGVFGAFHDGRYGAQQFGLSPCARDFNGDGFVDGADLGLLLGAWGGSDPVFDASGDGVVDGADLGLLLGAWGPCD